MKKGSSAQRPTPSSIEFIKTHSKSNQKQHHNCISLACAFSGLLTIFYFVSALHSRVVGRKANAALSLQMNNIITL